jgi:hypothetical protein
METGKRRMHMKRQWAIAMITALWIAAAPVMLVSASGKDNLAAVRDLTSRYHRVAVAQAAGYAPFQGCLEEPGTGGMGYHYVNFAWVDLTVDAMQPEAMVYAPGPHGQKQLGAVEYIVPAAAWDAAHPGELPELFGHEFLFDPDFGTYELHVWLWQHNPAGMFAPWNPRVRCPAS